MLNLISNSKIALSHSEIENRLDGLCNRVMIYRFFALCICNVAFPVDMLTRCPYLYPIPVAYILEDVVKLSVVSEPAFYVIKSKQ